MALFTRNYRQWEPYLPWVILLAGISLAAATIARVGNAVPHQSQLPYMLAAAYLAISGLASFVIYAQRQSRKRAETITNQRLMVLSKNESRLRAAIEGSNDGIWDHDLITGEIWFSNRWYEMLGYQNQEFPASKEAFERLVHPDDIGPINHTINESLAKIKPYDIQFRMRKKNGEYLWMRSRGFIQGENGKAIRVSGLHSDISKEYEYSQKLERAREAAEEASRAKAEFLANMSHEIRTPLNGIIGVAELLQQTELSEKQRQYVSILQSSSMSLFEVVNEVLDFSKIEAGQMKVEMLGFDLAQIAIEAIELSQHQARQKKGLEVLLRIAPDLPARYISDPTRIRQCLLNLLSNAVKFTSHGYVMLNIEGQKIDDRHYEIALNVEDTGIGIPDEKLNTVFEQFTQADTSTTRQYGGTGLGLAIVKTITEMLGGSVSVTSKERLGTRFTLTIPMELDDAQQTQVDSKDIAVLEDTRVLVIDDNATNLTIFEEILEHAGLKVEVAETPEQALTLFKIAEKKGSPYRFAVIDYNMPGMNGEQLVEAARKQTPELYTQMILTASTLHTGDSERLKSLGFKGFLQKPVTGELLVSALIIIHKLVAQGEDNVFVTRHSIREAALPGSQTPHINERNIMLRVLIVEDNRTNQQVLGWIFDDIGYHYAIANHGQEALELLKKDHNFDAILMDCQMPIMDGFETTKNIRAMAAPICDIPIIALTANANKEDQERTAAAGMDAFLTKPVDPKNLRATLASFVKMPERGGVLSDKATAASIATQSAQIIDIDSLKEVIGTSRDRLDRFGTLFETTFSEVMAELETCLQNNDVEGVRMNAHTLKGAAANLHALQIRSLAIEIEHLAKDKDLKRVATQIQALKAALPTYMQAFNQLKESV